MTSDGLEEGPGTNPGADADNVGDGQGGGGELTLDKVAELLEQHGVDIRGIVEAEKAKVAKDTAEAVGRKAQQTYDPKIAALEKTLKELSEERDRAWEDSRKAELAKLPPEQRAAAEKLFEGEKTLRYFKQRASELDQAAKIIEAEKVVIKLQKQGIECSADDFADCATPEAMHARAAEMRADELERKLKEVDKGTTPPGKPGTPDAKGGMPAAASSKPAPRPASVGSAPRGSGPKPYEDLKGKGLSTGNLAEALRRMREAE